MPPSGHVPSASDSAGRHGVRLLQSACNEGTGGADGLAAFISRLHPDHGGRGAGRTKEIRKLIWPLDKFAPGVREEMRSGKHERGLIRRGDFGLMQSAVWVHADAPRLKAYLTIFAAKFAMALYRQHVGVALGLDGAVWCEFQLNVGLTQENVGCLCRAPARLRNTPAGDKECR